MKKILLYAYDKVNLGDDLFIEMIVKRYSKVTFYMISDITNKENFKNLKNLKIINKDSYCIKALKKLWAGGYARYEAYLKKQCDVLVYIGGSIFIEYPTWPNIVSWWNYHAKTYPLYIIGANFGPYQSEDYRLSMGKVFNEACDVCFRDEDSYNLFKEKFKVRYAPDIIFSKYIQTKKQKRNIFISVINCNKKDEGDTYFKNYHKQYVGALVNLIKCYLEDQYTITICSFCKNEGDEETVYEISSYLNHQNVNLLFYDGVNRNEILDKISESCYVIGTRFHSIVLGMIAYKPVFPIIYSKKTKNMLKDIGFQGNYLELADISKLNYSYSKVNLDNQYIVDVSEFQKNAEKHFVMLDKRVRFHD